MMDTPWLPSLGNWAASASPGPWRKLPGGSAVSRRRAGEGSCSGGKLRSKGLKSVDFYRVSALKVD